MKIAMTLPHITFRAPAGKRLPAPGERGAARPVQRINRGGIDDVRRPLAQLFRILINNELNPARGIRVRHFFRRFVKPGDLVGEFHQQVGGEPTVLGHTVEQVLL